MKLEEALFRLPSTVEACDFAIDEMTILRAIGEDPFSEEYEFWLKTYRASNREVERLLNCVKFHDRALYDRIMVAWELDGKMPQ